jgi:hypothetical protein
MFYLALKKETTFISSKQKYYFISFFFYKIGEQEGERNLSRVEVVTSGRGGKWWGKEQEVNMVQEMFRHVCKCKSDIC